MPKVTLNYGVGTQHFEVSDSSWRLIKPHPINTRRLINTPNGVLLPVASKGSGSELWMFGDRGAPLIVNGHECGISLGLGHESVLRNRLEWGKAWLFPKSLYDQRNSRNASPLSSTQHIGQYAVAPIVDPTDLFVGFFVKSTITAGIARGTLTFGWVWKADKGGKGYFVILKTGEACWGLGLTAGAGVGILTGMKGQTALENFVQSTSGLNVTVAGGSAQNYLRFLRVAENSQLFGEAGQTLKAMSKAKRVFDGRKDPANKWYQVERSIESLVKDLNSHKGTIASTAFTIRNLLERNLPIDHIIRGMGNKDVTIEVAKLILTCLGTDGTKPGFSCIGADVGVEVSVSAGYTATHFVTPL